MLVVQGHPSGSMSPLEFIPVSIVQGSKNDFGSVAFLAGASLFLKSTSSKQTSDMFAHIHLGFKSFLTKIVTVHLG